jgi:hypothetical protein
MGRRVLLIVFVAILVVLAYVGYHSYDAKRAGANGDVFSRQTTVEKVGTGAGKASDDQSSESEKIVYPSQSPAQAAPAATPAEGGGQTTQSMQPAPSTAPGTDTISANPPNGMTFSGSGRYQLYRQGNITWRLDTDTGRTCIIFATEEEWKKPQVYRAGCGRS